MNLQAVVKRLQDQHEVIFKASGNSMHPRVRDGEVVTVEPVRSEDDVRKGDVVLVRVAGSYLLHLVSAVEKSRVQISNNKGRVNGWVTRNNIYGRLVE